MAMFDRFKKKGKKTVSKETEASDAKSPQAKTDKKAPAPAKAPVKDEKKKEEKAQELASDPRAARYSGLLLKPHVSEKAAVLADRGIYVFDVPVTANKIEIRKAVEAIYNVNVKKVRTERGIGKPISRGRIAGRRNAWKKALVELKKGQTISLVEGV